MKKIIYRKEDLKNVCEMQDNTTFEWEIEHNVLPNYGGTIDEYDVVETDLERPELYLDNGQIYVKQRAKNTVELNSEIFKELSELDTVILRQVEQIYDDLGITPSHQPMAKAMARKKELRTQIR